MACPVHAAKALKGGEKVQCNAGQPGLACGAQACSWPRVHVAEDNSLPGHQGEAGHSGNNRKSDP